jgi:uncharacterized membrane protein YecN with MAPEG domain
MAFPITSFVVSLLALFYFVLAVRVIQGRRAGSVSLGDGGDPVLTGRIRAHANFAEYVPIGLILIFVSEANGFNHFWLGSLALLFAFSRILHGYGMAFTEKCILCRAGGTAITLGFFIVVGLWNIVVIASFFV